MEAFQAEAGLAVKVGRGYKRASDEEIVEAYRSTGSVWKAAKQLGLVGQTVHERLRRLGVETAHAKWDSEEDQELIELFGDPHLTIAEVAKRLNRTSASVSCRAGELGLKKAIATKQKRVPRGKGYDKQSLQKHLKALDNSSEGITKYCRKHGLQVESFAVAVQRSFPKWWEDYVRSNSDLKQVACEYCNEPFFPNSSRQRFCTRKCSSDQKRDRDYFGGNRRKGLGVAERVCQICLVDIKRTLHVHHVYGKSVDTENKHLVALCARCHLALEQICLNPRALDEDMWGRLHDFVKKKLSGMPNDNHSTNGNA